MVEVQHYEAALRRMPRIAGEVARIRYEQQGVVAVEARRRNAAERIPMKRRRRRRIAGNEASTNRRAEAAAPTPARVGIKPQR